MKKLNDINWQWFVFGCPPNQKPIQVNPLPDIECIQIFTTVADTCNYKETKKHLELELIGLRVNLYSMIIINQK